MDRSGVSKGHWEVGAGQLSGDPGEDNVPKVETVFPKEDGATRYNSNTWQTLNKC